MRFILSMAMAAMFSGAASAQVFKCTDGAGKTVFSDRACTAGQTSSTVRILKSEPAAPSESKAPARLSPEAQAYEEKRQQRRAQSDEGHRRIEETGAEVRRIRAENADPKKCAAARNGLAFMQKRVPLTYKYEIDYFEHQQYESLYCGN